MPKLTPHAFVPYLIAFASVLGSTALTLALLDLIHPCVFLISYAAIAFSFWYAGLRAGLLAIGLSLLTVIFISRYSLEPFRLDASNIARLLVFLFVALFIGLLARRSARAERRVGHTEQRYSKLIENSADAIGLLDAEGYIFYVNTAATSIFGYRPEELMGRNPTSWVHPDDRAIVDAKLPELLGGQGKVVRYEHRARHKDRSWRWVEVIVTNLLADPTVGAIVLNCRDITERRLAEEKLRKSEAKVKRLSDSNIVGILTTDLSGRVIEANDAFLNLIGYTRDELLAGELRWDKLTPPEHLERSRQAVEQIKVSGACAPLEKEYIRKDGTRASVLLGITQLDEAEGTCLAFVVDITQRKKAEERLRESEEQMRLVLQASNVAIWVYDLATQQIYWSPEHYTIFGVDEFEGTAEAFLRFVHPEDLDSIWAKFNRVLADGGDYEVEFRIIRPDGQTRWVSNFGRAEFAGDGQPRRFLGTTFDITERKEMELAVRQSEEQFRNAFDNAPIGMALASPDGDLLKVNRALCEITGYTEEELRGTNFKAITHPDDLDADLAAAERLLNGQCRSYQMEKRYFHKRGDAVWVNLSVSLMRDASGRVLHFIKQIEDVTLRKRAEESLRQSEERFHNAIKDSPVTVFNQDRNLRYTWIENPGFGMRSEDCLGKTDSQLFAPAEAEALTRIKRAVLTSGASHREEMRVKRGGVDLYYDLAVGPLRNPAGEVIGLTCAAVDITRQKFLELELLQAQKMEAIGRLAGGVAHDFNNLLTAIIGYSQMGLMTLNRESALYGYVEEVKKAGERAASLTSQLLAFSRKQVLQPKVVYLNEVVDEMQKMLRRLIGEDIELVTNFTPELWLTKVDPTQIQQVVMNLAVNARDAMPRGGRLTIATTNEELAEDGGATDGLKAGDYVVLTMTDTGTGMDAATLAHIFEPFFTTKEQGKGTGLGLATVYGILKQSGGGIMVESKPGEGTTFKIFLPRDEEAAAKQFSADVEDEMTWRGSETVLLVEDEAAVRTLAKEVLQANGYNVLEASGPPEAIQLSKLSSRTIDLMLTDVVMPTMSGKELADYFRSHRPAMRVLYMSGYTGESLLNVGALPPESFIHKPFKPSLLLRRVREALNADAFSQEVPSEVACR